MRYFYRKGDRVSGPFDLERIRGALSRGSIDQVTPVTVASGSATEPTADATWVPLSEAIPELFGRQRPNPDPTSSTPKPVRVESAPPVDLALRASGSRAGVVSVEVVNVRMDFWAMVFFMVKWAIATIPAVIILMLIIAAVAAALGGVLGGILSQIF